MGLPPQFRDSIAVRPEGAITPRQGEFANPLADGNRIARSLLATTEPFMVDRAQTAALEDAGAADLVKDADGNYQLPDAPKGGLAYARVFDETLNERLVVETMFDFESMANETVGAFRNDPNGFLTTMRARAEAKLAAAPERARPALEKLLTREMLERHRGLADDLTRRTYVNEVNGIEQSVTTKTMRASRLLMTGTAEGMAQAREIMGTIPADYERLVTMGAMGPEGSRWAAEEVALKLGDQFDYGDSMQTLATIAPVLAKSSDEDLARLALWSDGIDTPGQTVGELTFKDFRASMRSNPVMNVFQQNVRGELSTRGQQRAEALAAQRHAQSVAAQVDETKATERLIVALERDHADGNFNSTLGYDRGQVAAINSQFGSIFDNMRSREGRNQTLALVSKWGVAPKQLIQYLDGSIDGDNMKDTVAFIASMQQLNVKGNNVGNQLFDQLSPNTRALYRIYTKGIQTGASPASIQGQVEAYKRGPSFSVEDARKLVASRAGTEVKSGGRLGGYDQQRANAIAKASGAPLKAVSIAGPVMEAFDAYLPTALQVHGGDVDLALADAAQSVAANFKPNRIFLSGFGPAQMFQHNVALGALSAVLPGRGPKNPTGAKLKDLVGGQPRVRLEPLYNVPLTSPDGRPALGRYRVLFFDAQGRQAGEDIVDMDVTMANARRVQQAAGARAAAAAPKPKPTGPRWQLRKDPRTGKVRYMDTSQGQ